MKTLPLAIAWLVLTMPLCLAVRNTDLKPLLVTPGRQTADETFSGTALSDRWSSSKGECWVRDGTLIEKEKIEDSHPAGCHLLVPNHDSILRFSFQFAGADFLSMNYNIPKAHLFRLIIAQKKVMLRVDRDELNPASKVTVLGTVNTTFEEGKWYTVQIEVKGPEIVAQCDSGWVLKGSHPRVDVDKLDYRFAVGGGYMVIADVKAWEAAAP